MNEHAANPADVMPVVMLGAGGHARVLQSLLNMQGRTITAALDDDPAKLGQSLGSNGLMISGSLEQIAEHNPDEIELVNAVGSSHRPTARQAVYEKMIARGYRFATLWHPSAIIAKEASIEPGTQVMASATIQASAKISANALINTAATIEHDTTIGEHCHIAPGATLCGNVTVGQGCHIGAGATLIQGITVGAGAIIGAGATVIRDVKEGQTVVGTPAK